MHSCPAPDGSGGNGSTPAGCCTGHPAPPLPTGFEPSNGVHVATSPSGPWRKPSKKALVGYPFCDCPAVLVMQNGRYVVFIPLFCSLSLSLSLSLSSSFSPQHFILLLLLLLLMMMLLAAFTIIY